MMMPNSAAQTPRTPTQNSTLPQVPVDQPTTGIGIGPESDTPTPSPFSNTSRATGDTQLAALYASTLPQITGIASRDSELMLENIPPHSTFGQWWAQLGRAMQSPDVGDWMRSVGIDTRTVQISPETGQISYKVQHHITSNPVLQSRGQDDKRWAEVSGPVMQAGKVIAANYGFSKFKPPLSENSNSAPLWLVGRFYRERATLPGEVPQRVAELERDKAFHELPLEQFSSLHETRSEESLDRQRTVLANHNTQRHAAQGFMQMVTFLKTGDLPPSLIGEHLEKNTIPVDPDSTYAKTLAGTSGEISLKQYLQTNGWDIPTTGLQVENLVSALLAPDPKSSPYGNYGGALTWPDPLDRNGQQQLLTYLRTDPDVSRFNNVLEYLMQGMNFEPAELQDPQRVIDRVIQSPKGQALGEAIMAEFETMAIKGSAEDWLLAALSIDESFRRSPPGVSPKANLGGCMLATSYNYGKNAAEIIKEIVTTLGRASSPEKAKIQVHLLLSTRAPEFLVKDIPDKLIYGTHSWVSFVTAVDRLEASAPGSTATMNYAQVMLHASIAPVSAEERQIEYVAQENALKDWALANGLGYPRNDAQIQTVRDAFNRQIQELSAASQAQRTPMPIARDIALAALKNALPDMDPALFDKKCMSFEPDVPDFPGPYSIMDLYLDGRSVQDAPIVRNNVSDNIRHNTGDVVAALVSSSADIDTRSVLGVLKELPDVSGSFKATFRDYSTAIKKSLGVQFKSLISKQPLAIRKDFEEGKITIVREDSITYTPYSMGPIPKRNTDNNLLFKIERAGKAPRTYEVDLKNDRILERTDLGDFQPGKFPLDHTHPGTNFVEVKPVSSRPYPPGLTDEKHDAPVVPNSYSSERTSYIADAFITNSDIETFEKEAQGLTTFDTEVPFYKKFREFMLNLIPLRSAIINFQEGKIGEGILDLSLDIFGFMAGIGAAAKSAKALQVGASLLGKTLHVGKIVGRGAIGALNPLDGLGDLAIGGAKLAGKGAKSLSGAIRNSDLLHLATRADVAELTVKGANGVSQYKTLAKVDTRTGKVYRYSAKADKVYGRPLEGFSMNPGGANDRYSLLGRQLAVDNVVDMGGTMRDIKAIDKEIFTFVNDVQGTSRLTIVAHGWERNPLKKLFNLGSTVSDFAEHSYTPAQFLKLLGKHGIDPKKYDSVRFVTCFSGEAGTHSFAAKFGELTGKPVAAFEGTVTVNINDFEIPFKTNLHIAKIKNPKLDENALLTIAEEKLKRDFEGKVDRILKVDNEHKRVDIVSDGLSGNKQVKQVINYRPAFYGKKPWNTAG